MTNNTNAILRLTGEKQGEIQGDSVRDHRGKVLLAGGIVVVGLHHSIISPRDEASGLPTGRRKHSAFTVIKGLDKSSPQLYQMLVTNEGIVNWELQVWNAGTD